MTQRLQLGDYYGLTHSAYEVVGLKLAEREYPALLKTPMHAHSTAHLSFVLAGGFEQTYGSKKRLQSVFTTTFYSPRERQSEMFSVEGCQLFNVELDANWYRRFCAYGAMRDHSVDFKAGSIGWLMSKLVVEYRAFDPMSPLTIEGITLEIIGEASRKFSRSHHHHMSWLSRARDILHDHFADNLTISQIAKLLDVHPVYLATAFRKVYHCTIGDYRRRLRVEFACRELATSRSTLAEVALAAGFADQAHFSKTFKRLTGTTPAKYRADSVR